MDLYRIMRIVVLAMALSPAAQAPEAPGTIRGIVINAATNQPVVGAVVELIGIDRGKVVSRPEISGKDGRFELRDLPPAKDYQLTVSDDDEYFPMAYGQHQSSDPWTPISLSAGQTLSNVRLVMTPLSSITGKVVDGSGKALSRATVYVLRATYIGGRRELQRVATFETLSNGSYFIGRLGPGQYYVRVNPMNNAEYRQLFENPAGWDQSRTPRKEGEPEGYPTYYYPNTTDLAAAKPVDLLHGGRAEGINIVAAKVRTRRVSGTVTTGNAADSSPMQVQAGGQVILMPRTAGTESNYVRIFNSKGGEFEFRGVVPGAYYLVASISDRGRVLRARKPLDIGETDLTGVVVTAAPGIDLNGTVRFEGWMGATPPDFSHVAVNLAVDTTAPIDRTFRGTQIVPPQPLRVPPSPDGQFVLRNIPPGDYRIFISLNPSLPAETRVPLDLRTSYLKTALQGNVDIQENGLHLDGLPRENLQLSLATTSGSVFGRVIDENKMDAVPERLVIAPDKARRKRFDLYSLVPVSATGRFSIDGIPPGDYRFFAWSHVETGAWLDPEFMRMYENLGTPIHIEESSSNPLEVMLIR